MRKKKSDQTGRKGDKKNELARAALYAALSCAAAGPGAAIGAEIRADAEARQGNPGTANMAVSSHATSLSPR